MKSNWKQVKLGEVCDVKGGKRLPKGEVLTSKTSAHPYIKIKDIKTTKHLELDRSFEYITEDIHTKISKYIVNVNDIIISIVGSIGLVAKIGESLNEANLTENCVKLINRKNIDENFLYYFLSSNIGQEEIKKGTVGAVQAKLPIKNIQEIKLFLPPIETQKQIAKILSSIDDKIELNNKINDNLEKQAQAIFKSWFVDFEPFGGVIPADWNVGTVGDVIELHDAKRVPLSGAVRDKMTNKLYPYYGAASLMDYVDNYIFDGTYLLLGEDGTVVDSQGYPILQYVWGKFWVNNHAHILTGKNGFTVESLYLLFKQTPVKSVVTGAVQPKISQGNLKSIEALIPELSVMNKFNDLIKPFFLKIKSNKEEIGRLSQLRDTLLPKLMSGEIDVSKVEV